MQNGEMNGIDVGWIIIAMLKVFEDCAIRLWWIQLIFFHSYYFSLILKTWSRIGYRKIELTAEYKR